MLSLHNFKRKTLRIVKYNFPKLELLLKYNKRKKSRDFNNKQKQINRNKEKKIL